MIDDYMAESYTPFEQNMALAWAAACLVRYDREHPHDLGEKRAEFFSDAVSGGLSLALEWRERNRQG